MVQPNPGAQLVTPLTGSELIDVLGVEWGTTTTGAIAGLATAFDNDFPTNITTTVGTTIPASAFLTGLINRSGPTAAYSDTTDTAANIAAAINPPSYPVSFYIDIKNTTAFPQTLLAGTGVTISSSPVNPANSIVEYLVVVSSATTITFNHIFTTALTGTNPEAAVNLVTVGAGVITGQGVATQLTVRSGSQSNTAFTDTTDTAANIIAAQPNVHVGSSWEWTYENTTNATATITGGTGVTVSGVTTVPAGSTARYLVTYTAAATVTIQGFFVTVPITNSGTVTANGASAVVVANTNVTANSVVIFTLKTVGGTPAGAPFLSAVTAGTGFSVKAVAGDTSVYNYLVIN